MTFALSPWLAGRRAIVAGASKAARVVATAFAAAGAQVESALQPSTDSGEIAAAFDRAEAKLAGGVDILVHAGVAMPFQSAEAITLDDWRASLNADIDGRFLYAAEFARRRIAAEAGGAILFLLPSGEGTATRSAAVTADGAMANLVKSLAVEWGRLGLRTNAIRSRACEPGGLSEEAVRASLANLSAYLVSDYAAYVTGCLMGVNEL